MTDTDGKEERITLAHGHGGIASHKLIREAFLSAFSSPELDPLDDAAIIRIPYKKIAFSTDSFVVQPIFFPGGDIGSLAVAGTINDVAVMGAVPLVISVAFIIEEGFLISDLVKIIKSMAKETHWTGTRIATGDTKVVPKGAADGIFINTTGIGVVRTDTNLSGANAKPGQAVLLSGPAGDHGAAIICARNDLGISGDVVSDCRPLSDLIHILLNAFRTKITVMRDPTRGGVATTLNEIARSSNVGIEIDETSVPIRDTTRAVCEILGFDPLYLANEGAILIFIDAECVDEALEVCRTHPAAKDAAKIGEVRDDLDGKVVLKTATGGRRIMDMLAGEMLPRIC
jgi:hydrogenase expression/formation protein HypE